MTKNQKITVKGRGNLILSIQKACKILKCFKHEKNAFRINELCEKVGYSKSTVHRICITLEKEGFLIRDNNRSVFILSPKIYELGMVAIDKVNIKSTIFKFMQDIVRETGESTALYIRHNFQRICIEKLESTNDLRRIVILGKPLPLCIGASGKVFLAWMPSELQKPYLKNLEKNPPQYFKRGTDQLEKELIEIKRQGFAISSGERVPDSTSVSVPIFKIGGEVLALTIMGPSIRIDNNKIKKMINILQDVANKVNYLPEL